MSKPILNKPQPKIEPPKEEKKETKDKQKDEKKENTPENNGDMDVQAGPDDAAKATNQPTSSEPKDMEVD